MGSTFEELGLFAGLAGQIWGRRLFCRHAFSTLRSIQTRILVLFFPLSDTRVASSQLESIQDFYGRLVV
jgi:hypothetical protein